MADKSALQMCESLLEQLPTPAPTQVQNLMWAFLKGIEGFDNSRAAECLGQLLDAHYDTIGVLQLATKQDLIEDAGLKAGDALRIVSAAKSAVAGPNPTSALPWASESYQPACESQELRKKRAKTVAQETWESEGQDVVKHAVPMEEIIVTVPKHVTRTAPKHACGVCNVTCKSRIELRSHFNSMTHAHSMDLVAKTGEINHTTYLHCSICNVTCNEPQALWAHYNGKKHRKIKVDHSMIPGETPVNPNLGATVRIEGSSTLLTRVVGPSPFSLPMQKPELKDPKPEPS